MANEQQTPVVKTDAEKYAELARASFALVQAISKVHKSPEYQRVLELYRVHGFTYQGPTFDAQTLRVIDVLKAHREPAQAVSENAARTELGKSAAPSNEEK